MSIDTQLISLVITKPENFTALQRLGVTAQDFVGENQALWNFIVRSKRSHGAVPSYEIVKRKFPDFQRMRTRESDVPILLGELRQRRKMNQFLDTMIEATRLCQDPDDVDEVMALVQQQLNSLVLNGSQTALVDVASQDFTKRIVREMGEKRRLVTTGVMTGFPTLDKITGGLQQGRFICTIGRAGSYKSWMNLFCVAEAIMQGKKAILYPLEMTMYETMIRLYTILSDKMFGGKNTFRNLDLSKGRVNKKRFIQFLSTIEEKFNGQLIVADIQKIEDQYTIDRIEAEVEVHQPHLIWVDYLTLMRSPGSKSDKDWQAIGTLSTGMKGIALRQNVIGGASAQVNREFVKARVKVPRLEHISFGDSLAADADQVVSIAKEADGTILYALVKNRHGPEIPPIRCKAAVNNGKFEEIAEEEDED